MIVIKLIGGLGNQMFQYGYGLYLSTRYNCPLYIDKSVYRDRLSNREFALDIFEPDIADFEDAINSGLVGDKEILLLEEEDFHFSQEALAPLDEDADIDKTVLMISGYWQSEKYFVSIQQTLQTHFRFKNPLKHKWSDLQKTIVNTDSVMINVRRGDYLNYPDIHGVVSIEYIIKGMSVIKEKIKNPAFFVFSDDIVW